MVVDKSFYEGLYITCTLIPYIYIFIYIRTYSLRRISVHLYKLWGILFEQHNIIVCPLKLFTC